MRHLRLGIAARSVLAALAALLAVGAALYGNAAKAKPTGSPQLVNALGEDDLGKFAVVDMAAALERVTAQDEAAK